MIHRSKQLQKAILKVGSKATTKSGAAALLFSAALMCSPMTFANNSTPVDSNFAFTVQVFNSLSQTEHLQLNYNQAVRLEQLLADTVANLRLLPVSNDSMNQPFIGPEQVYSRAFLIQKKPMSFNNSKMSLSLLMIKQRATNN